jgi:ribosomal protein S14
MISRRPSVRFQLKERKIYRAMERRKIMQSFIKCNARRTGFHVYSKFENVRIKNNCLLTGEARGVYSGFKLSRYSIKKYFSSLYGLKNSSW